ncbi:hypothetical protein yrohd0001_4690 [Yersinia rohdei ATCC 43380]|nr:hypothetical protein yrohd0001_4690 [Yersinia rohdei ATCC 43380]
MVFFTSQWGNLLAFFFLLCGLSTTVLLAAFTHPNHILMYAHRDEFNGCLAVMLMTLSHTLRP